MSLLPEDAHFEELVQDCFLAFKGAGLMLSPLDAELLAEWAREDVPYEVVARGIRRAAERALWDTRPGEPALHSLRACRREVGAEIKKYKDRAVGKGEGESAEPRLEEDRNKKLRSALKKFARQAPAYAAAVARLLEGPLSQAPADLGEASRREDAAVAAIARAMPFEERIQLSRELKARCADGAAQSVRARRLARRFQRAALVRARLDLPTFW